ncbi:MAG: S8 family serine peptidase [Acidobacteriota bacterium]
MRKSIGLAFALLLTFAAFALTQKSSAQKSSRLAIANGQVIVKLKAATRPLTIDATNDQLFAVAQGVGSETGWLREATTDAIEPLLPATSQANDFIAEHGFDRVFVMKFDPQADLEEIINRLKANASVEYAEPNIPLVVGGVIPDDPGFGEQWALRNLGLGVFGFPSTLDADIKATQAWEITEGSANVLIAVTDTGLDITHPDLAPNVYTNPREIPANNLDDDNNGYVDDVHGANIPEKNGDVSDVFGHGTQMSGIIAAKLNNTVGISGMSQSKLVPVKFFKRVGPGPNDIEVTIADAARAILYSINIGADIINASWSSGIATLSDDEVQTLQSAVTASAEAGVLFVTIAGNEGYDIDTRNYYPAKFRLPNQIVVAASQYNDEMWHPPNVPGRILSGFGKASVDLTAPGMTIFTTAAHGSCAACVAVDDPTVWYNTIDGTSAAAAYVSGVAALIKSRFNDANHIIIKRRILESVDVRDSLQPFVITGGRLNAHRALTMELTITPPVLTKLKIKPNGKTFIIGERMQDGATLIIGSKSYPARFKNGDFSRLVTSIPSAELPTGTFQAKFRNPDGGESNVISITR